MNKLG